MRMLIAAMLVIAGIIHLLPLSGVVGAERLATLYGMSFADSNLAIIMRHRAVLFGLLGALMIAAAFRPELQVTALIGGFISVVSFLWIAGAAGDVSSTIARIVCADWIALACLVVAVIACAVQATRS